MCDFFVLFYNYIRLHRKTAFGFYFGPQEMSGQENMHLHFPVFSGWGTYYKVSYNYITKYLYGSISINLLKSKRKMDFPIVFSNFARKGLVVFKAMRLVCLANGLYLPPT